MGCVRCSQRGGVADHLPTMERIRLFEGKADQVRVAQTLLARTSAIATADAVVLTKASTEFPRLFDEALIPATPLCATLRAGDGSGVSFSPRSPRSVFPSCSTDPGALR